MKPGFNVCLSVNIKTDRHVLFVTTGTSNSGRVYRKKENKNKTRKEKKNNIHKKIHN